MMSDRLLRDLGDLARKEAEAEQARLDERWDRLAAGTLTAEEETELKALAASSPEAGEAYAAFRPLGADFQARVANAINSQRASEAPAPEPREERPRVLPFRRLARRMEVWIGAAAAVAAGVFFLVRGPAYPPLPQYQMARLEGEKVIRGGEPSPSNEAPVYTPGSPLTITTNPFTPVTGPVDARAFLSRSTGHEDLEPWKPNKVKIENGSVSIEGVLGDDLQISPGEWVVWTVVARPRNIPKPGEVQARLRSRQPANKPWREVCSDLQAEQSPPALWQIACQEFRVEVPSSP